MAATEGALAGLRVVDFGHYLPGPLMGMLMADAGAEVIEVERPGGPLWDTNAQAILQRGKQRVALDLKKEKDVHRALDVIATSDVLIENFRPGVMERLGLGPETARALNPSIVYARIPGFARHDERAAMPGWESVISAATSIYRPVSVSPGAPPINDIPVFTATPLLSTYAALIAAHAAVAALIARRRTGQGAVVDVPLYDVAFDIFGTELQMRHDVAAPGFQRPVPAGLGHYQGSDGAWIHLCLFAGHHLRWFIETFAPSWLADGLADRERLLAEPELHAELAARLAELISQRPAAEWETTINDESGAPAALCQTTEEWLHDDHAFESKAIVEIVDPRLGTTRQLGQPVVLTGTPLRPRPRSDSPAPATSGRPDRVPDAPPARAGANGDDLPLDGIRVVDFTQVLAGPTAGRVLAEYGADVVKINNTADTAIMGHTWVNAGKRSILLDLKAPASRQVIDRLLARSDVVLQNFALGVADRLGIGPSDVHRSRPNAIYLSVNAFGPTGRRAKWRGREELGQAVTGIQSKWRNADGVPSMKTFPISDIGSGHLAAFGALLALYARLNGHAGQEVTASLAHTATFLQTPSMLSSQRDGIEPEPPHGQDATGWGPLHRLYRAADTWLVVAADQLADRLGGIDGLNDVDADNAEAIAERIAGVDAATWCERIISAGGAAHVVVAPSEILRDPVAWQRGLLVDLGGDRLSVGAMPRLTTASVRSGPPVFTPGVDGQSVIADMGLDNRWNELIASGAIVTPAGEPNEPSN